MGARRALDSEAQQEREGRTTARALPLSSAQALAQADALVSRRLRKRRAMRFGLLLAGALSVMTGALGAVLWEARAAKRAPPAAPVGGRARPPAAERVSSNAPAPRRHPTSWV